MLKKVLVATAVVTVIAILVVPMVVEAAGPGENRRGQRGPNEGAPVGFVDEDGDGICDNSLGFVDENGDGIYDNSPGSGFGFVDEDGDGVCDYLRTARQFTTERRSQNRIR